MSTNHNDFPNASVSFTTPTTIETVIENPNIANIENDVKIVEHAIEEILEIAEPQYVAPADYCFGFCNIIIDLFLMWLYNVKVVKSKTT